MDGGQGADYMSGGAGNDTYYADNSGDVIDDKGLSTDQDTVILTNWSVINWSKTVENAQGSW